ncbi:hypothetical protein AB1L88_18060 [Tautonia sp. JC769]|uniref:hypothetical protein n=1 Tax=Tautonia sp. JC769 TaxID=3232135 RepID=UPI003459341D
MSQSLQAKAAANPRNGKWSYFSITGPDGWYDPSSTRVQRAEGSNCNWHVGSGKIVAKNRTTLVVAIRSSGRRAANPPPPPKQHQEPARYANPEEVINPTDGTIVITLTNATPPQATVTVDYYDDDEP